MIFLSLFCGINFLGLGFLLSLKDKAPDENYLPSPLAGVVDQYHLAYPSAPLPNNYSDLCAHPKNPIVAENCQKGTEDWIVRKNSFGILGFASSTSVNKGESIQLYVDTSSPKFRITIFRLGYYAGLGGRMLANFPHISGIKQPPCQDDFQTGLVSCSNWTSVLTLNIPANWISGIYMAKLVQEETGGENYIIFAVRDDNSRSPILYQQSVTTYQAYNNFGGKSLYTNNSNTCLTVSGDNRAVEVSFDRPYNAPMGDPSTFFKAEYPMVRWLEAQGYWVTYSTDLDTEASGFPGDRNLLLNHKIFLVVGHDEYWSENMRAAVTTARDAGVNLGIFSGNTSYWRVRFTPDPWSKIPDRTMVAYKSTESGGSDPSGIPTTTWRDPGGAGQPENSLFGIQYIGDNETNYFPLRVYAEYKNDPLLRNSGLDKIPDGSYVNIGKALVGWEWDGLVENGTAPRGVKTLFSSPVFGEILQNAGSDFMFTSANAIASYYQAASGAFVFATGTIQWSWGLDLYEPNPAIQQITNNILYRMGVKPDTPIPGMAVDKTESNYGETAGLQPEYPTNPPVITDVKLDLLDQNKAKIRWQTDKPSTSEVWYWSEDSTGYFDEQSVWKYSGDTSDKNLVLEHQLNVPDLAPGVEYHFKIVSQDENGNAGFSAPFVLTNPPGSVVEHFSAGIQELKAGIVCGAKPLIAPVYNFIWQVNGWIVSGFVSIIAFSLGFLFLSRRTRL